MSRKLFIHTWGCQMNEYDSQRLSETLGQTHDLTRVDDPEDADVILLNTCAIRERATEKMYSELGRYRRLKDRNPDLVIGVGGCVATHEGKGLEKRSDLVDLVFGPQSIHRVPGLLQTVDSDRARETTKTRGVRKRMIASDLTFQGEEKFDSLPVEPGVYGVTAFVSIMEGCSKHCTFCVVPMTRGPEFSRAYDAILKEIDGLAAQGVREVNLLGQNVNAWNGLYGRTPVDFGWLLEQVAAIEGIARVRFTTSHPVDCNDSLYRAFERVPEVAGHLHLPVQSGSDRVLRDMRRGYTRQHYEDILACLRDARPGITFSSDFIVGFPGETEEDFLQTLDLAQTVGYDRSFSFGFSPRARTVADAMKGQVPHEIKQERLQRLQRVLRQSQQVIAHSMVGTVQDVLVTDYSKRSIEEMQGRSENDLVVTFPKGDPQILAEFVRVNVTEALNNSLRGVLVSEPSGGQGR